MTIGRIPGWKKYQHYSRRNPPWIKLYRKLLDDPSWNVLPPDAAKFLVELWLLVSEDEHEGDIPDMQVLVFRLRRPKTETWRLLNVLSDKGFAEIASTTLAPCKHLASAETETETETETESGECFAIEKDPFPPLNRLPNPTGRYVYPHPFVECLEVWPQNGRVGKGDVGRAYSGYRKLVLSGVPTSDLLDATRQYAATWNGVPTSKRYIVGIEKFFRVGGVWQEATEYQPLLAGNPKAVGRL